MKQLSFEFYKSVEDVWLGLRDMASHVGYSSPVFVLCGDQLWEVTGVREKTLPSGEIVVLLETTQTLEEGSP